ncbi:hypothetical protein ES702_02295 [subsurface metagenome]
MTKKTIILVLITLLVINTIFWLYIGISVYRLVATEKIMERLVDKATGNDLIELILKNLKFREKITAGFGGMMIATFEEIYPHTPFIILAITDIVLIAISFMIILLYKKDLNFKR